MSLYWIARAIERIDCLRVALYRKGSRTVGGVLGSLRDLELGWQLAFRADRSAENLQLFRDALVVDPSTAFFAIHEASVPK